jgi:hypothetical protein
MVSGLQSVGVIATSRPGAEHRAGRENGADSNPRCCRVGGPAGQAVRVRDAHRTRRPSGGAPNPALQRTGDSRCSPPVR